MPIFFFVDPNVDLDSPDPITSTLTGHGQANAYPVRVEVSKDALFNSGSWYDGQPTAYAVDENGDPSVQLGTWSGEDLADLPQWMDAMWAVETVESTPEEVVVEQPVEAVEPTPEPVADPPVEAVEPTPEPVADPPVEAVEPTPEPVAEQPVETVEVDSPLSLLTQLTDRLRAVVTDCTALLAQFDSLAVENARSADRIVAAEAELDVAHQQLLRCQDDTAYKKSAYDAAVAAEQQAQDACSVLMAELETLRTASPATVDVDFSGLQTKIADLATVLPT